MLFSGALVLHILSAVIWVGGMFFAYMCLRHALGAVTPEVRLKVWVETLRRFFLWVFICIGVLFFTGFYLIVGRGGFGAVGLNIYLMLGLAVVMTGVFKFVYVAPFRHLQAGVESGDLKVAAFALGTIRKLVATNLVLGMLVVCVAVLLRGVGVPW